VSTSAIGLVGQAKRKRAIDAAERRACSAISASMGSPSQPSATSQLATGARKRSHRAAVWALPLLAPAAAGETMRTRGKRVGGDAGRIER